MAYIKDYWENRETSAEHAKQHTREMSNKYWPEINYSVENTTVYGPRDIITRPIKTKNTEIIVEALDTVSAGEKYRSGKTALLNFASYKEPGGRFIDGSKAQEECLCHASFLYNVLVQFQDTYYAWNNENKNRGLYLNRALYSPAVAFNDKYVCDVITCAAPNKYAAQKYMNVPDAENLRALKSRIDFLLMVAHDQDVKTLILGAYGCGVFGQNPYEVAGIFKELLETKYTGFDRVVFGIPEGRDGNLAAFEKVFGGNEK